MKPKVGNFHQDVRISISALQTRTQSLREMRLSWICTSSRWQYQYWKSVLTGYWCAHRESPPWLVLSVLSREVKPMTDGIVCALPSITLTVLSFPAKGTLPDPLSLSLVNCQYHFLSLRCLPRPLQPTMLFSPECNTARLASSTASWIYDPFPMCT